MLCPASCVLCPLSSRLTPPPSQSATLRCLYSPGHTDDSVCFALAEDCALLSGDSVLGCGTSVFDNLHTYLQSLHAIRLLMLCQPSHTVVVQHEHKDGDNKVPVPVPVVLHTVYPGHGPVVRARSLQHIDAYIENRQSREKQLVRSRDCFFLLCLVSYLLYYPPHVS